MTAVICSVCGCGDDLGDGGYEVGFDWDNGICADCQVGGETATPFEFALDLLPMLTRDELHEVIGTAQRLLDADASYDNGTGES